MMVMMMLGSRKLEHVSFILSVGALRLYLAFVYIVWPINLGRFLH